MIRQSAPKLYDSDAKKVDVETSAIDPELVESATYSRRISSSFSSSVSYESY